MNTTQPLPLFASWASIVMVVLLILCAALLVGMFISSRRWTVPRQDSLIRELRRDVDHTRGIADGVAREHGHHVRRQQDIAESMLAEIRKVSRQVDELLTLRDKVREVDDRTTQLDQVVSALACSEKAWLASTPGYCPLLNVACPLTPAKGTPAIGPAKPETKPEVKEPKP